MAVILLDGLPEGSLNHITVGRDDSDGCANKGERSPVQPGSEPGPDCFPLATVWVPDSDSCIKDVVITNPAVIRCRSFPVDVVNHVGLVPVLSLTRHQDSLLVNMLLIVVPDLREGGSFHIRMIPEGETGEVIGIPEAQLVGVLIDVGQDLPEAGISLPDILPRILDARQECSPVAGIRSLGAFCFAKSPAPLLEVVEGLDSFQQVGAVSPGRDELREVLPVESHQLGSIPAGDLL